MTSAMFRAAKLDEANTTPVPPCRNPEGNVEFIAKSIGRCGIFGIWQKERRDHSMKRLVLLLIIALCLAMGSQPLAAAVPSTEYDLQCVQDTFLALQRAYAAEDVDLFLSCHEQLLAQFDRPRDEMIIIRQEVAREEISALFAMLDGLKMEFLNLEIAVDGDTAVARTLRRGTAAGFPEAIYCRMAFTLRRGIGQRWRFTNYTIYDEWTELVEDPNVNPSIKSLAIKPGTEKHKSMFF